eukprot:GILK01008951.1.p1 GENE.GILK01008951.1~~GILK01008951.1.p1  ORF type:complete len:187 (+),score=20.65 GILK01008951.1:35-562(+)
MSAARVLGVSRRVLLTGNRVLRAKAAPVVLPLTESGLQLANDITRTMIKRHALGLAAPQIGRSNRMFVMSLLKETEDPKTFTDTELVINPQILSESKDTWAEWEGCLSVPGVLCKITRPHQIEVEYTNRTQLVRKMLDGWQARCFLHEYDHLEGKLIVDKIKDPSEMKQIGYDED